MWNTDVICGTFPLVACVLGHGMHGTVRMVSEWEGLTFFRDSFGLMVRHFWEAGCVYVRRENFLTRAVPDVVRDRLGQLN